MCVCVCVRVCACVARVGACTCICACLPAGIMFSLFFQDGNQVTETCAYGEQEREVCAADCTVQAGEVNYCGDQVVQNNDIRLANWSAFGYPPTCNVRAIFTGLPDISKQMCSYT